MLKLMLHLFQENKSYGIKPICIHLLMSRHYVTFGTSSLLTFYEYDFCLSFHDLLICLTIGFEELAPELVSTEVIKRTISL